MSQFSHRPTVISFQILRKGALNDYNILAEDVAFMLHLRDYFLPIRSSFSPRVSSGDVAMTEAI